MSLRVLPPFRQHAMISTENDHEGSTVRPETQTANPAAVPPSARRRDAAYIQRFLAGDESAFNEIMRLHRGKLYAIVVEVVRNPSDAEELVQDTFVRAHRGLARFRGDSSLATWLYHIAVNLARNRYWYFRRRHRHNARSLDAIVGAEGSSTFAELIADGAADPSQLACQGEFATTVGACMRRLSPCQREILALRCVLDLSYEDIGSRLGIRAGTVKSRIARARHNLRILVAETYPGAPPEGTDLRHWFESPRANGRLTVATP